MIAQVIELLQSMDFKGGTENIEFAKGSYRYPRNIKETFKISKRWLSRK
jgi:hypothetical protein